MWRRTASTARSNWTHYMGGARSMRRPPRAILVELRKGEAMNPSYKPRGYTTVSPYLIVDGASDTIDFLARVFGAAELRRFPDSTGKLMHAEVRIEDSVVMIADGVEGWPPVPSHVHVYVPDVD